MKSKKRFEVRVCNVLYSNPAEAIIVCMEGRDKANAIRKVFKYLKKHSDYDKIMTFDKIEVKECI